MRIALVQAAPAWHDAAANRELFAQMIDTIEQDVDLVVLPEMFSTGFTMSSGDVAETMAGETVTWMRDQATQRGVTIVGSVVIEDGQYFNRLVWMPPDGRATTYDKRHLFRMAGEHEHYAAGRERVVLTMGLWRVCVSVCYDLRFRFGCGAETTTRCCCAWRTGLRHANRPGTRCSAREPSRTNATWPP